jgi:hypothetical protein
LLHCVLAKEVQDHGVEPLGLLQMRRVACLWNDSDAAIREGGAHLFGNGPVFHVILTHSQQDWHTEAAQLTV